MGLWDRVRGVGSSEIEPSHKQVETLDNDQLMRLFKKQLGGAPGMMGGQWLTGGGAGGYNTGPARLRALENSYGGTNDSVSWVFSCVTLVASTLGSYPWRFTDAEGETLDDGAAPVDLARLLLKPNPQQTYFDLAEAVVTDCELVGNSYLLKNEMNALGQPKSLFRLRPDRLRMALALDGTTVGYVYTPQAGVAIPYDRNEIIHFRYPNPLDDNYGMGTVEAIASVLDQYTAEGQHITGFFQNGARISGVLTIPETLGEVQYERLKQVYTENYQGPANAYKMLIAEGASGYQPITQGPVAAGVVDLLKVSKDETLAAFGVPAPLLGGLMENANYKMEESQHIFLRAMLPRARRFAERITVDLAAAWGVEFRVDAHANEPLEVRIAHAAGTLGGGGASVNEAREMRGQPPSDDPMADKILVPATLIPLELVGAPPRPGRVIPMETNSEPGAPSAEQAGATEVAPSGGTALQQATAGLAEDVAPGTRGYTLPTADDIAEALLRKHAERREEALEAAHKAHAELQEQQAPAPPAVKSVSFLKATEELVDSLGGRRRRPKSRAAGPLTKSWAPPEFPRGFEQPSAQASGNAKKQAVRDHQAKTLRAGVDVFEPGMRAFFQTQRNRVLHALSEYGGGVRSARLRHNAAKAKADLTADGIFDLGAENTALQAAYLPMLDAVGHVASSLPVELHGSFDWSLQNPHVVAVRDRMSTRITRVNDTTRQAVADAVSTGMARGYSIPQIANGFADENYGGVMGAFDQASGYRAEMIARTESALAFNAATVIGYTDAGVEWVEIMDGTDDEECAAADGEVWSVDDYDANPLEHPNCSRTAVPSDVDPDGNPVGDLGSGGDSAEGDVSAEEDAALADEVPVDEGALADEVFAALPNEFQVAKLFEGTPGEVAANMSRFSDHPLSEAHITAARKQAYERTQASLTERGLRADQLTVFRGPNQYGVPTNLDTPRLRPASTANGSFDQPVTVNRGDVLADPGLLLRGTPTDSVITRAGEFKQGPFNPAGTRLAPAPRNATQLAKDARLLDPTTVTPQELIDFGKRIADQVEAKVQVVRDRANEAHQAWLRMEPELDRLYAEKEAAQQQVFLREGQPEPTQAMRDAYAAAEKAFEDATREYNRLGDERWAIQRQVPEARAKAVRDALAKIRPMGGTVKYGSNLTNIERGVVKQMKAVSHQLPKSWVERSNEQGALRGNRLAADGRAYYTNLEGTTTAPAGWSSPLADGQVSLTPNQTPDVVLHEMTHRMEYVVPDVQRIEDAYLEMRKVTTEPEKLSVLMRNNSYEDYEVAYRGDFVSMYQGKVYQRLRLAELFDGTIQPYGKAELRAGEFLTMAQQGVWYNYNMMWERDPEAIRLALGMLAIL